MIMQLPAKAPWLVWLMAGMLLACGRDNQGLPAPTGFLPAHFPPPVYNFAKNEPTSAGFELGKALFYDPITSVNSSISCASCHFQAHAFSDVVDFSSGVAGRLGIRNSPPLQNLAWKPHFNADGGINHLDLQPIAPITDTLEHAFDLKLLFERLRQHPTYPQRFTSAFGSDQINDRSLLLAISQFVGQLISADSKYDAVVLGKSSFSNEEAAGYRLFQQHCNGCHTEPLFSNFDFKRNGYASTTADEGRARITGKPSDIGKFSVPSLRNIAVTAPYMHDGQLNSLADVLDSYAQPAQTPDPRLGTGVQLSPVERSQLLAFLHTLTDVSFLTNPAFKAP
jgi:cytochrome c peroxidase